MVLPININPGTPDPLPTGVFLIPLCTDQEGATEMLYALDTAYKMSGKIKVIKDFLNALQHIANPYDAICMTTDPPLEPVVTIETDGDCTRVLIDGLPVTDWICPPDIEQPEPQEPTVGTLGFTVSELESIAMGCLNLDNSIKWVNGVLWIRTCDGWQPVPGGSGAVVQSGSGNAGQQSFDEWVDSGSPEIAPTDPVPHVSEFYTTLDSLKCAKATALVNEMWNVLTIGEAVEDTMNLIEIGSAVSGALALFAWPVTVVANLGFGLASTIWTVATGAGFSEYADDMGDIHANLTMKNDLICDLVDRMVAPVQLGAWKMNTLTAGDIKIAMERFEVITNAPDHVMKTLGAFSVSNWQEVVKPKLVDTECGCEDFLPYGYTPPTPEGSLSFDFVSFAEMPIDGNAQPSWIGSPLDSAFDGGLTGELVGGMPQSVQTGSGGGYAGGSFGAYYQLSAPATLTDIKMSWSFPSGSTYNRAHCYWYDATVNEWKWFDGWYSNEAPPYVPYYAFDSAPIVTQHLVLRVNSYYEWPGTVKPVRLISALISGTFLGQGFVDLGIGEVFTP